MILNLTQHVATPEQRTAGVEDLKPEQRKLLSAWLTFEGPPSREEVRERAALIAQAAANQSLAMGEVLCQVPGHPNGETDWDYVQYTTAMIGGAPFLMGPLEAALEEYGITAVFAFSERCSEEQAQPDGSVRKVAVFRHVGFV